MRHAKYPGARVFDALAFAHRRVQPKKYFLGGVLRRRWRQTQSQQIAVHVVPRSFIQLGDGVFGSQTALLPGSGEFLQLSICEVAGHVAAAPDPTSPETRMVLTKTRKVEFS